MNLPFCKSLPKSRLGFWLVSSLRLRRGAAGYFLVVGLGLLGLCWSSPIRAQNPYYPNYPPGYNPYYPPGYTGGVLQGRAEVIRANGDLSIQYEQARIEREKALQAKLDTKKQAFDQMMYEKANTPSYA